MLYFHPNYTAPYIISWFPSCSLVLEIWKMITMAIFRNVFRDFILATWIYVKYIEKKNTLYVLWKIPSYQMITCRSIPYGRVEAIYYTTHTQIQLVDGENVTDSIYWRHWKFQIQFNAILSVQNYSALLKNQIHPIAGYVTRITSKAL